MYHKKIRLGVVVVVVHDRFCRCTLFNHCSPLFVAQNAESSKRKKRAKRIFLCCVCVCVCVLQHFIIINDFVFGCQQSIWRCRILNPAWSLPLVCVCHLPLCRINIFFRIWIAFPPKSIKTCPYSILLFYIGFLLLRRWYCLVFHCVCFEHRVSSDDLLFTIRDHTRRSLSDNDKYFDFPKNKKKHWKILVSFRAFYSYFAMANSLKTV